MSQIRNCKFSFKCPRDWEALKQTDNIHQRYCEECKEIVHFCYTPDDLMKAMTLNQCVAIAGNYVWDDMAPIMVGRLAPRYGDEL